MKYHHYQRLYSNSWFWRTQQQQEIDYLEETGGLLSAFEFKWNQEKKFKIPSRFSETYPDANLIVINRHNFLPFVGLK